MFATRNLYGPADIEAHRGKDGRFYVLDLARVFPPEPTWSSFKALLLPIASIPDHDHCWKPPTGSDLKVSILELSVRNWEHEIKQILKVEGKQLQTRRVGEIIMVSSGRGAINTLASLMARRLIRGSCVLMYGGFLGTSLYSQLRPEFVVQLPHPVSSDAWSRFSIDRNQNQRVQAATRQLQTQVIPGYVQALVGREELPLTPRQINESVHRHGINFRYFGLLRSMLASPKLTGEEYQASRALGHLEGLRSLVLLTMISRVLKNFIESQHRELDTTPALVISRSFNLAFGSGKVTEQFWTEAMILLIQAKYLKHGHGLSPIEETEDLRNSLSLPKLLVDLCDGLGGAIITELPPGSRV